MPLKSRTRKNGASKTWSRDRAATDAALMEAALRLLERDGVLVGLNMQEVAREAGVNRGNIHHNFGSRRALLRAALDRGLKLAAPGHEEVRRRHPNVKGPRNFRDYVKDPRFPRVIALLALDGDETLEPIVFLDERLEDCERERAEGSLAEDVDMAAMLTTWDATMLGYSLIREAASRQMGIPVSRLDRRVLAMLGRLYETVKGENSQEDS